MAGVRRVLPGFGAKGAPPPPGGDVYGFNFRASSGFVTDGPDDEPVHQFKEAYPEAFHSGAVTAGQVPGNSPNMRDRNNGYDPRCAGIVFYPNNGGLYFRMDIPAGNWNIEICAGDAGDWNYADFSIWDGIPGSGTLIADVFNGLAQMQFFDAMGNGPFNNDTAWVNNQVPRAITITDRGPNTCCCVVIGRAGGGGNAVMTHIKVSN